MKNLTFIFTLILISFATTSGETPSGLIRQIMVHSGDIVIFNAGEHSNKPECSTVGSDWALSLSSEKGKAMYALLLSASAQGLPITVIGENACNAWGDRESPHYMLINYQN